MVEIALGSTDGMRSIWVAVSVDWKAVLITVLATSLISEFDAKIFHIRSLVSVRAEQVSSKCWISPGTLSRQMPHDPSLSVKCRKSWSVLYRPDNILAWITALEISYEFDPQVDHIG